MLLGGGGGITLNSFCFGLYVKDVFLGLVVRVRARTCYALAHNSALLAILISIRLVSAILYNVFHHLPANTSHLRTPKTTKNRENRTLVSQQWLNNKFQNFIVSLLYLF